MQSYRVKSDYIENVKQGSFVSDLLNLMCNSLGHSQGKPVDVSKWDITSHKSIDDVTPLTETQMLLTHLYYRCLSDMPALTKAWWIDCKSRQTVMAVESWTEKYVRSPNLQT